MYLTPQDIFRQYVLGLVAVKIAHTGPLKMVYSQSDRPAVPERWGASLCSLCLGVETLLVSAIISHYRLIDAQNPAVSQQ